MPAILRPFDKLQAPSSGGSSAANTASNGRRKRKGGASDEKKQLEVAQGRGKRVKAGDSSASAPTEAGGGQGLSNFQLVQRYQPLLHVEYLSADRLLVVEVPWLRVMQDMPNAVYRKTYGT